MGKHFGELAFIRGIVYYRLSPHEQKPFAGAIKYGLPNFIPRTTMTIMTWLPPFVLGFVVYYACEEAYRLSKRKRPQDYANEVPPELPPPPPPAKESKCKKTDEDEGQKT